MEEMFESLHRGDLNTLKKIFKDDHPLILMINMVMSGHSPLLAKLNVIDFLLDRYDDNTEILELACRMNNRILVSHLLNKGCFSKKAEMICVLERRVHLLNLFIVNGYPLDKNLLTHAVNMLDLKMVELLLKNGLDPNNLVIDRSSPLVRSVKNIEEVRNLMKIIALLFDWGLDIQKITFHSQAVKIGYEHHKRRLKYHIFIYNQYLCDDCLDIVLSFF